MKKTIILSLLSFTTLAGHADEGMWMLTDLKEQNAATMYDMGLDIGIDKVYCPDSIKLFQYQPERCRGTFRRRMHR